MEKENEKVKLTYKETISFMLAMYRLLLPAIVIGVIVIIILGIFLKNYL